MTDSQPVASSGVEALIERLKNEGITAGQEKAEDIVLNAQKRASWLIEEAELEAKALVDKARQEAEAIQSAGQDALKLAARDAFLKLRDSLLGSFSNEVMRVVGDQMSDPAFTEQLILALASKVRDKAGLDQSRQLMISLPEDVIGIDELKKNPEELKQGVLSQYTASIAADLLRSGIEFEVAEDIKAGLSIRLVDESIILPMKRFRLYC
jgi:V/A-type H+-transporting ATPase subunit E